jgi:predicted lipid carrier protein YhbT
MMKTILKQQRGVTFGGFIMVLALLGGLAIFAMKLIPAYMENGKIQKAFDAIVRDPAMQDATVREIKDAFYKRAIVMDDVTRVTLEDILISKEEGNLALSASYSAKIPLAGNVSLLIEFHPSAPK